MRKIEEIIKGIAMNPEARAYVEDLAEWADAADIEKIENLHENIYEYAEAENDPAYDGDALALLLETTSDNIDEALHIYEPTDEHALANAARYAAALDQVDDIEQAFEEITEAVALLYYSEKYALDEIDDETASRIRAYANDESKGETIAKRTHMAVFEAKKAEWAREARESWETASN